MQNVSALDELTGVDFSNLSLDRGYKVSDRLLKHKDTLEDYLRRTEGQLFALKEKIILYGLTNTFFEGTGKYNPKADKVVEKIGRSKERFKLVSHRYNVNIEKDTTGQGQKHHLVAQENRYNKHYLSVHFIHVKC